jgi:hypothetical protein
MYKYLLLLCTLGLFISCQKSSSKAKTWAYKVIPAMEVYMNWYPENLRDAKGTKENSVKIAGILQEKFNELGEEGWELVSFSGQVVLKKENP